MVEADSSTSLVMPLNDILAAELAVEPNIEQFVEMDDDAVAQVCKVSRVTFSTTSVACIIAVINELTQLVCLDTCKEMWLFLVFYRRRPSFVNGGVKFKLRCSESIISADTSRLNTSM